MKAVDVIIGSALFNFIPNGIKRLWRPIDRRQRYLNVKSYFCLSDEEAKDIVYGVTDIATKTSRY